VSAPSGAAPSGAPEFATIRYETTPDHVATITLDRPEVLNAFNRQMCEEVRSAWRMVKDDPAVHAVVLRAEGDRAFCAGLDTSKAYGQPDDIWNHEDPGELLSPQAADRLRDAGVGKDYRGREKASDHAPTWVELEG
jgi:enoyl-CoA hydratase/carnithine racemase